MAPPRHISTVAMMSGTPTQTTDSVSETGIVMLSTMNQPSPTKPVTSR